MFYVFIWSPSILSFVKYDKNKPHVPWNNLKLLENAILAIKMFFK